MSVTLQTLVDLVADTGGVTKTVAKDQLVAIFNRISAELKEGNEVTIHDFGRFFVKQRAARMARNPKTGESIQVGVKNVIKFVPRGSLKE